MNLSFKQNNSGGKMKHTISYCHIHKTQQLIAQKSWVRKSYDDAHLIH